MFCRWVCYSQALGRITSNPLGCWEGSPVWKPWVFQGPPQFNREWNYLGPIPRSSDYKTTLARRPTDKHFRTTGTATWPPLMCRAIANLVGKAFMDSPKQPAEGGEEPNSSKTPAPQADVGEGSAGDPEFGQDQTAGAAEVSGAEGFWGAGLGAPRRVGNQWEASGFLRWRRPVFPGAVETGKQAPKTSRLHETPGLYDEFHFGKDVPRGPGVGHSQVVHR